MIPPFCPNPNCPHHWLDHESPGWYLRNGWYTTRLSGKVQRFRCRQCHTHFSTQTFSIDYMVKKKLPYPMIFTRLRSGSGIRSISRDLAVTHRTILNRISRLARQALAVHAALAATLTAKEDLVTDGFESFVGSQYFPNNIHLLLGKHSQYLYAFDYAHLRRKGRMRAAQKRRRNALEQQDCSGKRSISRSFSAIIATVERLVGNTSLPTLSLYSDQKPEYRTVLARSAVLTALQAEGRFLHLCISATEPRTLANHLFSANYMDRELRKDCANFVRETTQFSRDVNNCMDRMALYGFSHNYLKPYRIDDPQKTQLTHAEVAGIAREAIERELSNVFTRRRFFTRQRFSWFEACVWLRGLATPGKHAGGYWPQYIWA